MSDYTTPPKEQPGTPPKTFSIEILESRFRQAFGGALLDKALKNNYTVPTAYLTEEIADMSKIGTPFFDRVMFRNGTTEYKFEIMPMIDMSRGKRLSITKINSAIVDGREVGGGEVIESMGNEHWDITFRGLLIDMDNHQRPLTQMRDLSEICKVNDVLDCKDTRLFNVLGINKLYVKQPGLKFPPLEGIQDTQPFILETRSYAPVELEILN
jgi:hypothetical protein